jgi:hypothetical protein
MTFNPVFPESIKILADLGSGFVQIQDVQLTSPIHITRGNPSTSQMDRLAQTGSLTFSLDNSTDNSQGLLGLYSLNNANKLSGWDIGVPIKAVVTFLGIDEPVFYGKIVSIQPRSGKYGERKVDVSCVDWMEEAATAKAKGVAIQLNKRSDEIFTTLLATVQRQPPATRIGIGADTYPFALDNALDEEISVMSEWQRLVQSEQGYGFVLRDGTLVFQGRFRRTNLFTLSETLTDEDLTKVDTSRGVEEVYNKVQVQAHPRRVDSSATSVLFSLASKPLIPRSTSQEFTALYRDPLARATRAGGTEMVTPVATTDYTFNTLSDGTGTDITSQLTITAPDGFGGNSTRVVVLNNGPQDGYLTKLQLRGKGVYDYETALATALSTESRTKYGERLFSLDMPYQHDFIVAQDAANFIVAQSKHLITQVRGASFIGNREERLMKAALRIDIGERVRIEETVVGTQPVLPVGEPQPVSALEFFVNYVELTIVEGPMVYCTWGLAPADPFNYWILERSGFTELDFTTRLGYGSFIAGWILDESELGLDTRVNP